MQTISWGTGLTLGLAWKVLWDHRCIYTIKRDNVNIEKSEKKKKPYSDMQVRAAQCPWSAKPLNKVHEEETLLVVKVGAVGHKKSMRHYGVRPSSV